MFNTSPQYNNNMQHPVRNRKILNNVHYNDIILTNNDIKCLFCKPNAKAIVFCNTHRKGIILKVPLCKYHFKSSRPLYVKSLFISFDELVYYFYKTNR